jgi:hypothetical protein
MAKGGRLFDVQSTEVRVMRKANEDDSRVRAGHATENLGWLRRVALALLKQDDSTGSIKGKRLKAGWDNDFLEQLHGLLDANLLPDK